MKINLTFNLADAPKIADQQSNLFDLDIKSNLIPVNFHNNANLFTINTTKCNAPTLICSYPCSRAC